MAHQLDEHGPARLLDAVRAAPADVDVESFVLESLRGAGHRIVEAALTSPHTHAVPVKVPPHSLFLPTQSGTAPIACARGPPWDWSRRTMWTPRARVHSFV